MTQQASSSIASTKCQLPLDASIAAAEGVDQAVAVASDTIIEWCLARPDLTIIIERVKHRKEHLDQIDTALNR